MGNRKLPSKQGQICQNLILADGEKADDVYIITDFVIAENEDSLITVVSLNELQRNITSPDKAERKSIPKGNLQVVADDLASYVESWNETTGESKNKIEFTPRQFLKLYPDKYVMVTYQFGNPIYIAPLKDLEVQITPLKEEAEIWSAMDTTETKLKYHIAVTGYSELTFEKVLSMDKDIFSIASENDVKDFFRYIHGRYPQEWHPDDDFSDFNDENGNRSFTDGEAKVLNSTMVACFQYCDDNGLDIYEIAGEVQIELWTKQGVWPPKPE